MSGGLDGVQPLRSTAAMAIADSERMRIIQAPYDAM